MELHTRGKLHVLLEKLTPNLPEEKVSPLLTRPPFLAGLAQRLDALVQDVRSKPRAALSVRPARGLRRKTYGSPLSLSRAALARAA